MAELFPNRLERVIAYVAPSWAAGRARARTWLKVSASQRGALSTRTSTPWQTSISYIGGNTSSRANAATMRDRGRNAYQNNAIARSLLDTETDYVVGDAFKLQSRTGNKAFDREAEKLFPEWLDTADYRRLACGSDLFRMSWREPRKDGDGGFLLLGGAESRLQYIPGDRIQSPWGIGASAQQESGTILQDGIETDLAGRPKAFWLASENELGVKEYRRVPAADFVYLPHLEMPLDLRGCSVYSPIFELLDQISGYVDAVVIAARMAAIFGLIFKSENPGREMSKFTTLTNSEGNAQKAIGLDGNGMIRMVGTADDVVQVQAHQPMTQTPDFIRAMFRLICLPFGLPIELGMKDVSQVTFISGRLGLRDAERNFKSKQCRLRSQCWYRIYEWWIARERKKQQLGFESRFTVPIPEEAYLYEFMSPPFPVADPLAEAQAELLDICLGKRSPQQVCMSSGNDWEETQQQIAEARDSNDELGIPNALSTLTRDALPEPADPAQPNEGNNDGNTDATEPA